MRTNSQDTSQTKNWDTVQSPYKTTDCQRTVQAIQSLQMEVGGKEIMQMTHQGVIQSPLLEIDG